MTSRAESAAATRVALLDAAASLLDLGGLEAVTLRAVGARAGVTRGAPYRHFADKESLLIAVGTRAWSRLGEANRALRADSSLNATDRLRESLRGLVEVGRSKPHLYQLMFSNPPGDPTALARAAQPVQEGFLTMVSELVGEQNALRFGALLISSANGIVGLEVSRQLSQEKWGGVTAEELTDTLIELISAHRSRSA